MKLQDADLCVCCGDYAGEGRHICLACESANISKDSNVSIVQFNDNLIAVATIDKIRYFEIDKDYQLTETHNYDGSYSARIETKKESNKQKGLKRYDLTWGYEDALENTLSYSLHEKENGKYVKYEDVKEEE